MKDESYCCSLFKHCTKKMKFSIKDIFSKCDQVPRKLRIWSYLLKKSLMENLFFCAVKIILTIVSLTGKHAELINIWCWIIFKLTSVNYFWQDRFQEVLLKCKRNKISKKKPFEFWKEMLEKLLSYYEVYASG